MDTQQTFPLPKLDALPFGAHRLLLLTDQALFESCGVRIAFSGREGGVSQNEYASLNCGLGIGDEKLVVQKNRELLKEALGIDKYPCIIPTQVHGVELVTLSHIADLSQAKDVAKRGADGIVVEVEGVSALLNFADCLPLIIVSPSGNFAVVHCGWRGTVAHIACHAAQVLADNDPGDISQFNAYIGPHIHKECFEVGQEVIDRFREEFGEAPLVDERHIDLFVAVKCDLQRAGLNENRIVDSGICTKCNCESYFSYRATGGQCGRQSAIACHLER